jgi:2'-5' RNA ligase
VPSTSSPAPQPLTAAPTVTPVTIGVAIAVPEPWGGRLQDYRAALGDPSAAGIPTHVTLMPPFTVEPDGLGAVEDHLAAASAGSGPFRIHLRGTGTFRPVSPVVFVTVAEGISGCEQLAAAVRRGPLAADLQFPYHPHVTVAHHLADEQLDRAFEELADFECDFVVAHFSLYVHDPATGWVATRDFALSAPVAG